MGEGNETATHCRGHETYGDHCTHNGPSARVWFDILVAALIIFGFFFWHLKWSERRRTKLVFEWNNDEEDSTGIGSSYSNDIPEKRQRPYYGMHPALTRSQRGLQAAKNWISDRFSPQRSMNSKEEADRQQQEQPNQSNQGFSYTAPASPAVDAEAGQVSNSEHGAPKEPKIFRTCTEGGSADVTLPTVVIA
jgi:hypothetical protein